MYDVVVEKFTFAISSPGEFLFPEAEGVPKINAETQLEAPGQCKPPPRHVLPVPPSGESL